MIARVKAVALALHAFAGYTQVMIEHYICTGGCEGVSEVAGVCGAVTCPKHGAPLISCDCTDGKHYGRMNHDEESEASHENAE
jgi:hypothetical protein